MAGDVALVNSADDVFEFDAVFASVVDVVAADKDAAAGFENEAVVTAVHAVMMMFYRRANIEKDGIQVPLFASKVSSYQVCSDGGSQSKQGWQAKQKVKKAAQSQEGNLIFYLELWYLRRYI